MSKVDFTVNAEKVEVEYAAPTKLIELSVEGIEIDDILTEVGIEKVLNHIDQETIAQYVRDNNIDIEQ